MKFFSAALPHLDEAKQTTTSNDALVVDLKLDARLLPTPYQEFVAKGDPALSRDVLVESLLPGKTYAIGSGQPHDQIFFREGDRGLFGAVMEAWKNHWVLRTTPEDWWFPIACRIAKAIDKEAQREDQRDDGPGKVRKLFVNHEGKETISVDLPCYTIYDANYEDLFGGFQDELRQRINVPEFVQAMQNDFSCSNTTHVISSQINLMSSLQQFFRYEMRCCGCGLRGLEMKGSVEDWKALSTKLAKIREILEPITCDLGLYRSFWDGVDEIFQNLAMTRENPHDDKVAKFWINILCDTTHTKYVGGGGSLPGRPVEMQAYDGWLIKFLFDRHCIFTEDLKRGKYDKQMCGVNTVPLNVKMVWLSPPVEDETTLLAGMAGYTVYPGSTPTASPVLEPLHLWAMLAKPSSPLLIQKSTIPKKTNNPVAVVQKSLTGVPYGQKSNRNPQKERLGV